MPQPNDLSRSLVALDQNSTIIAVIEMSQSSWLVAGMLPGIERQPRKKLEPSPERLLGLLHRWQDEAVKAGRKITRIALAFEAGRDGFWLARWLSCAWGGGACDPSLECRRIARTSPGEDRPARHRVTEAGVLGVAAWGTGPLHHGAHTRQLPKRTPSGLIASAKCLVGERTRIVNRMKGDPRPAGHSQLQTNPAQGRGACCNTAHTGGLGAAAECLGRVAAQYGAPGLRRQPDQRDRGGSSGTIRAGARDRATRHGTAPGSGHRRRH